MDPKIIDLGGKKIKIKPIFSTFDAMQCAYTVGQENIKDPVQRTARSYELMLRAIIIDPPLAADYFAPGNNNGFELLAIMNAIFQELGIDALAAADFPKPG